MVDCDVDVVRVWLVLHDWYCLHYLIATVVILSCNISGDLWGSRCLGCVQHKRVDLGVGALDMEG